MTLFVSSATPWVLPLVLCTCVVVMVTLSPSFLLHVDIWKAMAASTRVADGRTKTCGSAMRGATRRASPRTLAMRGRDLLRSRSMRVDGAWYHPTTSAEPLLRDVTLALPTRGLTLLVGRSGSGKSTLLHLLAGFYEADEGALQVDGRAAGMERRMECVGMVFQFPQRHVLGRTIGEELTFGWPRGWEHASERKKRAEKLQWAMEAVGVDGMALEGRPEDLSDGYKRRLAIAAQLARQPNVLLLDEPFAGLDWRTRKELVQLLRRIKRETSVLVASHDVKEIAPIVDAALEMEQGKVREIAWPPMPGSSSSLQWG